MGIKDVKINPELLKLLTESLHLLKEEKKNEIINILLKSVLQIIKKAQVYVKLKNIDHETILYQVIVLRRRLACMER